MGDLSILADGGPIEVLPAQTEEKVADEAPVKAQPANPRRRLGTGNRLITPGRYFHYDRPCRDRRQKRPASIRPAHRGDSARLQSARPGRGNICPRGFSRNLGKPPRGIEPGGATINTAASSWRRRARSGAAATRPEGTVIDSRCPESCHELKLAYYPVTRGVASITGNIKCQHQVTRHREPFLHRANFFFANHLVYRTAFQRLSIFSGTSCGATHEQIHERIGSTRETKIPTTFGWRKRGVSFVFSCGIDLGGRHERVGRGEHFMNPTASRCGVRSRP